MNAPSEDNRNILRSENSDVGSDRLLQLSSEVSRIASALAILSLPATRQSTCAPRSLVLANAVRAIARERRTRADYFGGDFFGEPAWDMMLHLLEAEESGVRVPINALCNASGVAASTALRMMDRMVEGELLIRQRDRHHHRRVFVSLAPAASQALRAYFADLGLVAE